MWYRYLQSTPPRRQSLEGIPMTENVRSYITRIKPSELPQLADAVSHFLTISLRLQLRNKKEFDEALAKLQGMHAFLARFSEMATAKMARSPVDVLDFIAKNELTSLGRVVDCIALSTVAAHMLQG